MLRARWHIVVGVGALVAVQAACSGTASLGGMGKKDGSTTNKTPEDPKKPTEDSEGLPGYLTDPAAVVVRAGEGGKATVEAPAGSVRSDVGNPEDVVARVYEVEVQAFQTPHEPSGDADALVTTLPAKLLGESAVAADGSFRVELSSDPLEILIVVLTPQASDATVDVRSGKGAVFGTAGTAFAEVTVELLAEDRRPDESTDTSTSTSTSTSTETATATSCGGSTINGGCWYLSDPGASCKTACSTHGGYDDKTNSIAGFGGTVEACYEVMTALGVAGADLGSVLDAPGVGCSANAAGRIRWTLSETNETAVLAGFRRACACKE
jgi:hypothetical protein